MNKSHKKVLFVMILITCIWLIEITYIRMVPFLDQFTQPFVPYFSDTFVYTFFRYITELGSKSWLIPFVLVMMIVFLFIYRKIFPSIIFGSAVLLAHLMNKLVKGLVERERPTIIPELDAVGYSFPSGHAMVSIVCYSLVAYFLTRKIISEKRRFLIWLIFIVLILCIGFSRYVVHVHFLTDVFVGYCFGFIIFISFVRIYEKYK